MANHPSIETAQTFDPMFGKVVVERKSFPESTLVKFKDKKRLGDNLLFWVGPPLVVNR